MYHDVVVTSPRVYGIAGAIMLARVFFIAQNTVIREWVRYIRHNTYSMCNDITRSIGLAV